MQLYVLGRIFSLGLSFYHGLRKQSQPICSRMSPSLLKMLTMILIYDRARVGLEQVLKIELLEFVKNVFANYGRVHLQELLRIKDWTLMSFVLLNLFLFLLAMADWIVYRLDFLFYCLIFSMIFLIMIIISYFSLFISLLYFFLCLPFINYSYFHSAFLHYFIFYLFLVFTLILEFKVALKFLLFFTCNFNLLNLGFANYFISTVLNQL